MKNAIGLILFGLLFQYGSADVSHLARPQHSQYLPPVNRNLPIEQDYNGIDSHQDNGYLPPDNENQSGYLPPYQAQNQHQHNHHNHHAHQDHQDHRDNHDHDHNNDHEDHSQNHNQQQQYDHHDHSQSYRNDQQHQNDHRNHQDYDPSVQVSYHNDNAVNQQRDHHHSHNDHSQGQNNNQDHYDNSHNDHVDIDQQQLEPVLPSSLPAQSYLPSQTHRHQNSVSNRPRPFTPQDSAVQQEVSPSPQNGYDYSPPSIQPTESLYPNQFGNTNIGGPQVADEQQHLHHGSSQTKNVGHTAPIISHRGHNGVSNQGYLPPSQSSHGNLGVLGHSSPQDYLPPTRFSHGNPAGPQREHVSPNQDYLPPSQGNQNHQVSHLNPVGSHEHGYLPPPQPTHQTYHPLHQGNHVSHFDHATPRGLHIQSPAEQSNNEQGYLPPPHSNPLHSHQAPQQDYLPPSHSNHGSSGNLPFSDDHTAHAHHESTHLPHSQSHKVASTNLPFLNDHTGQGQQESTHLSRDHVPSTNLPFLDNALDNSQQDLQRNYQNPTQSGHSHNSGLEEPQQDYLPPSQSNFGSHTSGRQNLHQNSPDLPNSSGALHVVPPPQLGSLHYDEEQEARSRLTLKGHVNVPLPIPQVGYFFVPGTVSRIPSLNNGKSEEGLRPALNIPALIGPQATQAYQQPIPTQRISSPEYKRTFLLPNSNRPAEKRSSEFSIIPSIQTQQDHQAQQNPQNAGQHIFSNLPFLPQSNIQSLPHINQNNAYHREDRQFVSPDNISNRGLSLQSIARSHVTTQQDQISRPHGRSQFRGSGYLPPPSPQHRHQHDHSHNQAQPQIQQQTHQHQNTQDDRGYLLPPPESHNQVTSLQTYMNAVDPSDRYGSSQYHNPPPTQKGAPSPPVTTSPPMFSKPSAVVSYAPGMAYKISTNTPFTTLNPAAYLPAIESPVPQQDHSSINSQLNEAAKKNLAKIMPKDNTVFPLEELLDIQDGDDIDLPQLMDELRGRVRTVQIINSHSNSVKNIKVLETADQDGVKTIKILGPSNEDPMGDHKIVHIVSKGSNPEGIRQTIKIFADHKEVSLPAQNAYLPPPPKATESKVRVSRRSNEAYRKH